MRRWGIEGDKEHGKREGRKDEGREGGKGRERFPLPSLPAEISMYM